MHYILFIALITTHWFSSDIVEITTVEFNNDVMCNKVKDTLNSEFLLHKINGHAECAGKGLEDK